MQQVVKKQERTEEIQHIIDRMPTKFGVYVAFIVFSFAIAMIGFGWFIKYPDIITGQIVINSTGSPIKLIANTSGKLLLNNHRSMDDVKEGDYLAIIANPAKQEDIVQLKSHLSKLSLGDLLGRNYLAGFSRNVSLGEISAKYFAFLSSYEQFITYYSQNLLEKQEEVLKTQLSEQKDISGVTTERLLTSKESLFLMGKSHHRDSLLFYDKVLAEADYEKSKMSFLGTKDNYNSMLKEDMTLKEQIQETINKLQQLEIQKNEKEMQLKLELISSYTALQDDFKVWEEKYVLKSPINGKMQFLKFWSNEQFVSQGEPVFTILPTKRKTLGQLMLPAEGAGKVARHQEVVIKLLSYPYEEYGTLKGHVSEISLTTNTMKTEKGNMENYLVTVDLPEKLVTSYGTQLNDQYEIIGNAEIITSDRTLISRLFDNLKYVAKK
ncbi:HlyD family secretion protein [Chitinophaga niastensis]|uniref:HlyD family secretion protein n=1 Tax=Chitinophaga niastensis TaxID=536980 RepID=A0A2P8HEQ2_CHINA|nr:HlyD family efflux transporter periplasmic adaptor subunit [Chitinophaga niastensis]PSL44702.1 HlyD family secretion protein [Chitinophaga niastensis]